MDALDRFVSPLAGHVLMIETVAVLNLTLGLGCGLAVVAATTAARIRRAARNARLSRGDLLVVFGAEVGPGGPSGELSARLEHAASLFEADRAPEILCSGGWSAGISEAATMRDTLVSAGVPEDAVLVDETGTSTWRTIAAARKHATGRRVLLVSSPYHLHRIVAEARRQGLDAVACSPPSTPIMRSRLARARQVGREVVAVWWYAATAQLRTARRVEV